jgi:ribosomal protein S18 acetylase RimI-like enzyme
MSEQLATSIRIRPCRPADAPAVAEAFLSARTTCLSWLPKVHADPDVRAWVAQVLVHRSEVYIAELDGRVVGFAALRDDHLDHLYVHPDHQNRGAGTALLRQVMSDRPNGLRLWVFQQNAQARRFYERHGFMLLEQTDGAANEERTPDALYGWAPYAPAPSPSGRAGVRGPNGREA